MRGRQVSHFQSKRRVRVTKSAAARVAKVSRRTVIRYAEARLVSEDQRGRVFVHEVESVANGANKKGVPRRKFDCRKPPRQQRQRRPKKRTTSMYSPGEPGFKWMQDRGLA